MINTFFMKKFFLLILLFQCDEIFAQTISKDYSREPESVYEVIVNGKLYSVAEGTELKVDSLLKPRITIRQSANRKFENSTLSFDYPKGLSFAYENEGVVRTWTLNGNDVIILVLEMDVEVSLNEFTGEIIDKFGKQNCQTIDVEKRLGGKICEGKELVIKIAEQRVKYECYSFKDKDGNSRFVFLQDTLDGERHTLEYERISALVQTTVKFKQ